MSENQRDQINAEASQHRPKSRRPLVGEEYVALRDEILKRIELQYQLLNLALIVVSTFITVSLGGNAFANDGGGSSQKLLLLCTPIEMFLALGWAAHNTQIAKAGAYIKANYDEGWETYWPQNEGLTRPHETIVRFLFTGGAPAMGVFVCTQALTLMLAYFAFPRDDASGVWAWYVVNMVMILVTAWFIYASNIRAQLLQFAERQNDRQKQTMG